MATIEPDELLLQVAYRRLHERPDSLYMTQPMGGDRVDTFSWARTFDEAKRVAAYLRSLDLEEKSQIAILSKNCAQFIITDLAIWMAGHVSVAIYPTLDADTVEYILDHSESKLLFVGKLDTYDDMKPGIPDDMPTVTFPLAPDHAEGKPWSEILEEHEPIEDEPVRDADDMALIVYTSGSTGRPKGVMHAFGPISISTYGVQRVVDVDENDRMLSYLPLAHVMERWLVECGSLIAGFQVFFAESLDTFVQDLRRAHPTVFVSVPRLWLKFQMGVLKKMPAGRLKLMLKIPILNNVVRKKVLTQLGLDAVRYAASGSAPIPAEVMQWYRDLGLELLEGYGMSENFAYSHASVPGKTRVGYVGNAYPEVDCKLTDEGEILVKSPGNMLGYFKQPEETAKTLTEDGYVRTGDRGEIDDEGRLRITGRTKELFKTSKGKYVAPAPIENIINNHESIELCCVFGSGQPKACAVVCLAEDLRGQMDDPAAKEQVTKALEKLLDEVNAKVVHHEQLQFFAVADKPWTIEEGFLTPTMKIKRTTIDDTYTPLLEDWYTAKKKVVWQA